MNSYIRTIVALVVLLGSSELNAATVSDTIYINRGITQVVDTTFMPYLAFNNDAVFNNENKRIFVSVGDVLNLTIINTDTVQHGMNVKNYIGIETYILSSDTATISLTFNSPGAHIYYDPTTSVNFSYLGLAGMIIVTDPNSSASKFYWNMKEHQKSFNVDLAQGLSVDWSNYYPDYFTINGKSNPFINEDTNARVVGNVSDTIHVYMVNTGVSLHSIHFHGYHSTIIYSTKFPNQVGRLKDTFPIYSMEAVIIELIPDKVGEYPVHDHNLVAVSGGLIYPNGMFLTLLIE